MGFVLGCILWLIFIAVAGFYIIKHVGQQSTQDKRFQNQKIALLTIILCGGSMWTMWACCYLHQMYPLIRPKLHEH